MIIFHEGLPRSGKSYECVVKQIIPAIKKSRKVFAYVEGLNHEKIADLCDITTEHCKELLIQIESDQVVTIYDHVENDSLVVIDELQDYFPSGRQKLSPEITKFVTQHGHRGLDIVCMGQNLNDCHNLWKRRVQRKIIFTKMDMLGAETRYSWEMFSGKATNKDIKFIKISSGTEKYQEKYFGTYKSHTDTTLNTENLKDDRANVFKTKGFLFGAPAALIVGLLAINHLFTFFTEPAISSEPPKPQPITRENIKQTQVAVQSNDAKLHAREIKQKTIGHDQTSDYIEVLSERYRLRLGGYISNNVRRIGLIQFYDDALHLKEEFTLKEMEALDWKIEKKIYGIVATKKETKLVIRSWPLETFGKVSNTNLSQL